MEEEKRMRNVDKTRIAPPYVATKSRKTKCMGPDKARLGWNKLCLSLKNPIPTPIYSIRHIITLFCSSSPDCVLIALGEDERFLIVKFFFKFRSIKYGSYKYKMSPYICCSIRAQLYG